MKVKSESEVAQSCPTLSDPTDRSLPGSSVHGIFQAKVLEWDAIAFSEIVWQFLKKLQIELLRQSVQSLSCVQLLATSWTAARQFPLSCTMSQSLLKSMFTELMMPSNHLILSPPSPLAFNLFQHQGLFQ